FMDLKYRNGKKSPARMKRESTERRGHRSLVVLVPAVRKLCAEREYRRSSKLLCCRATIAPQGVAQKTPVHPPAGQALMAARLTRHCRLAVIKGISSRRCPNVRHI